MATQQSQDMTSKTKSHRLWIIALLLLIAIGGGLWWWTAPHLPWTYSAEPIRGRVVDAETGEPLEKAIVIAVWELNRPYSMEGPIISGYMHVAEVLTDTNGEYLIEGWGPKKRPGMTAYLTNNSPMLVVFKDDYEPFAKGNFWWSRQDIEDYKYRKVHTSDWDGKTIEPKRFEGDLKTYYGWLRRVSGTLDPLFAPVFGASACDWKKIPQMMLAFDKYDQLLEQENIPHSGIPSLDVLVKRKDCSVTSKEDFIKEHQ